MLVKPPPDECALWSQRLLGCAQEWRTESTRLWSVGARLPVSGTCGEAMVAAAESLVREMQAVTAELDRHGAALRLGLPR